MQNRSVGIRTVAPDRAGRSGVVTGAGLGGPSLGQTLGRFARLATNVVRCPIALVTRWTADGHVILDQVGLGEHGADEGAILLGDSAFLLDALSAPEPLLIEDARRDARVKKDGPLEHEDTWVAFAGIPLISREGSVLGSLCVADLEPRRWSSEELDLLQEMSAIATATIEQHLQAPLPPHPSDEARLIEDQHRILFEAAPHPMWVYDPATLRFLAVNEEAERVYGYSMDEFLSMTLRDIRPAEDVADLERMVRESTGGLKRHAVLRHRTKEGKILSGVATGSEVRFDGRPARIVWVTDLTAQRESESALARSQAELSAILQAMRDVVFVMDGDGRYQRIAPTAAPLLYRPPEELLGRTLHEVFPPETADFFLHPVRQALASGETQYVEYVLPIGGQTVWFSGAVSRMSDDLVVWVCREITSLKQAEAALRETETRFQQLAENVDALFWISAPDYSEIHYINPAWERIWGRPVEDIHREPTAFLADVHPDDQARVLAAMAEVADHEIRVEFRIVKQSTGQTRWILSRAFPIRNEEGDVIRIGALMEDVTDSKRLDAELRRQHDLLNTIIDSSPDAIYLKDRDGRYQLVNRGYLALAGLAVDEVLGRSDLDIFPAEFAEKYRADDWSVKETGQTLEVEETGTGSGGDLRHFHTLKTPLRDESGQVVGVLGITRDITQRKRDEDALRATKMDAEQARRAAESANQAKSDFLSRMSHELRTPLNAILGFGQVLELDARSNEDRESVEQILKAGAHLLALIDEVLDISRIEAGQISLSVEPVPVRSVLRESVDLVRLMAANNGITLRAQDALVRDHFVQADPQRLKQVLLNLLSNAIKYNRMDGTVTLSCEEVGEDRLRIVVRDTGYGIRAQHLSRLFTPFERLGAEQRNVEGTGLGLALSKGLAEAMGGTLGVESIEGQGSRFWVELSLAVRPERTDAAPGRERTQIATKVAEASHTVLFVEDNLANVRLMERVLQRRPRLRLLTAMQGSLGLDLAREHHPDLILLDLNLPDLSGDQILLQLQRDPALRDIPVVMVSGDAIPSQVQRLLDLGARRYITKPFNIQEILQLVDDMVAGARE